MGVLNGASAMGGAVRIGISGWRYEPWRGDFYPADLVQDRELDYASRRFNSIELNGTFYSLQRPGYFAAWRDATPPGFLFSVKGPRYITHLRRLKDVEIPIANFLASGVLALNEKLGPFLWQFPPNMKFDAGRFAAFFALLPRDTAAALALARRHDAKTAGRAHLAIDRNRRLRHAVEIRNETFVDPAFVALARRHRVALVVADTAGKWPYREDVTSDFLYLRLHGAEELYASGYTGPALDRWAERIRAWATGGEPVDAHRIVDRPPARRASRDVYCYFDNDIKVRAPYDAQELMRRLDVRWSPPESPRTRGKRVEPEATPASTTAPTRRTAGQRPTSQTPVAGRTAAGRATAKHSKTRRPSRRKTGTK
jgi:uncharacterized protein YecE (DUF72 family)